MIEVAFDQDDAVVPPDRFARLGQAVEKPLLLKDGRLGGVQVLRLSLRGERPSPEPGRTAAVVAHGEEQAIAKAVVGALAFLARLREARLDEQALGEGGRESAREGVPGIGRVTHPEAAHEGLRDAALLQVRGRAVAGLAELGRVEAVRRGEDLVELLLAVFPRPARDTARDGDAEARREGLDRLRKVEPVHLPHEVDDVASGAAPEAVVEPFLAVHREGRRPLVVERAEPLPGAAGFLQARVLANHLDDIRRAAQLRQHVVGNVQIAHAVSSTMVAPLPPSRASAERSEATPGNSRKCSRMPARRRPVPCP